MHLTRKELYMAALFVKVIRGLAVCTVKPVQFLRIFLCLGSSVSQQSDECCYSSCSNTPWVCLHSNIQASYC